MGAADVTERQSGPFRGDDPTELGESGRFIYGATPPGGASPCSRTSPLCLAEIDEVMDIIARGRMGRCAVELPERLRTRDWASVLAVVLRLDERMARPGAGWKIGAASEEVRRAEGLPSPSPGRIYEGTIFSSGAVLGPDLFINYRNIECEFAFQLGLDFPVRDESYSEADAEAGIDALFPALELGDTVFLDWYGASGYFGSCLDNGGGAALVEGPRIRDWRDLDLAKLGVDLYLNDCYIKSGTGHAAMGHPVTSLTWMLNWARSHGRSVDAGEVVSTGTCTGHCFAAPGDTARADFGPLGLVQVGFR
jgi:2-keto-4-pentenoate hydratase